MSSSISQKADILKSYEQSLEKIQSVIQGVEEDKVGSFNIAIRHISLLDATVQLTSSNKKALLVILRSEESRIKKQRADLIKDIQKAAS